jgi:hypothetical protein
VAESREEREERRKTMLAERMRNCQLGADLVTGNAKGGALVIYAGADGAFYFTTNNRTWAMGAIRRVAINLDERERVDTRRNDMGGEEPV